MQQPNDPRFQPTNAAGPAPFRADVPPAWSAYAHNPGLQPMGTVPVYGDAAGEYVHMKRGRYSAMVHVVFAFLAQCAFLFGIAFGVLALAFAAIGGDEPAMMGVAMIVAGVLGAGGAWWTFRDRWKVIEAFSSRFCSGLANLSVLYVPAIAWGYANYRAIQKFRGR
jgi:hypothetical protein